MRRRISVVVRMRRGRKECGGYETYWGTLADEAVATQGQLKQASLFGLSSDRQNRYRCNLI